MAINDSKVFDPAKRIVDAIGPETVANIEADAIKNIVDQANVSGSKSTTSAVRNNQFDVNDYLSHIVHTNPINNGVNSTNQTPVTNATREDALNNTFVLFNKMSMAGRSKGAKLLMKTTGFDKTNSRSENITNVGNVVCNIVSGVAVDYITDVYSKKNASVKSTVVSGFAGAAIDFVSAYAFSGNKDTVEGLFDPNNISSAEADIINKAIRKEKVTYAAEHTAFSFIAPFAVSTLCNKFLPESVKGNKIVSTATSFGVLSTVGKLALNGVRSIKDSKELKSINGTTYAIVAGQPCEGYETIAKYATRRSIDSRIDASIYGSVGCLSVNTALQIMNDKANAAKAAAKVVVNHTDTVVKPVEVKKDAKTAKIA